MKINEVEKITGITSANIRYYERKELLAPKRENENNYRLYNTDDIERLKQIKILRMMGVSIADIREILGGNLDLKTAITQRIDQLAEEEQNIATVKNLCHTVLEYDMDISMLNEELLMENTEMWQKKLLYTNLEEKAYILNRKVSIILCLATILSAFFPLVFYNERFLNIIQICMAKDLISNPNILLPIAIYIYVLGLYGFTLYCHLRYRYSYYLTFLPVLGSMAWLAVHAMLIYPVTGSNVLELPSIICFILSFLRTILGFLTAINYSSGENFYIKLLKRRIK